MSQVSVADSAALDVAGARGSAALDSVAAAACPLCRCRTRPWLTVPGDWRKPEVRRKFELAWCDVCRYGSLVPRPELADLASFYDVGDYYTHHAPRAADARQPLFERVRRSVAWRGDRYREGELIPASVARFGLHAPATICDIGCGNGGLLRRMAAAGYEVVGIEPDADACRSAEASGLRVVRGSAESPPPELSDARFAAVTMMHVLEHTLDPRAAVETAVELLAPDGLFFVEVPNHASLGSQEAGITWRWLDVPRHLNFFTPHSLRLLCEQARMEIVGIEYAGYVRQFDDEWIADEREIARRLTLLDDGTSTASPPANGPWRATSLLARTLLAADEAKYDSVRVVARKR